VTRRRGTTDQRHKLTRLLACLADLEKGNFELRGASKAAVRARLQGKIDVLQAKGVEPITAGLSHSRLEALGKR
jgi:hypothetical protein